MTDSFRPTLPATASPSATGAAARQASPAAGTPFAMAHSEIRRRRARSRIGGDEEVAQRLRDDITSITPADREAYKFGAIPSGGNARWIVATAGRRGLDVLSVRIGSAPPGPAGCGAYRATRR
jgi:hypothetical protein